MNAKRPRSRYRKGLKVDLSHWEILRDTYALLDPSHDIPRSPRFAFSAEPFLILSDPFGRHGLKAGVQRTEDGRKVWWLVWLRDGEERTHLCPESLQELLFYLDDALLENRRITARHRKRTRA